MLNRYRLNQQACRVCFFILIAAFSIPMCGRDRPGDCPQQHFGCGGRQSKNTGMMIHPAGLGSSLSLRGEISDTGLVFSFKPFAGSGTLRDLFNYIYFQGDTICFSFCLSEPAGRESIDAGFINPATGKFYKAERIDINGSRISGFSLTGSIMEHFFKERLGNPIPRDGFCCRDIPFLVKLSVRANGKIIESTVPGAFRIEYR